MKNKTVTEIKEIMMSVISDNEEIIEECGYDLDSFNELDNFYRELVDEVFNDVLENEKYTVGLVSSRGGEGDGAPIYATFYVQDKESGEESYIEFYGHYSSWDSSYYRISYLVEPKEIMVTIYEKIEVK